MKGVYHQLALKTVDADETLRLFNGLLFEEMISSELEAASIVSDGILAANLQYSSFLLNS